MKTKTLLDDGGKVQRTTLVLRTPCGKHGYTSRKRAASAAKHRARLTGEPIHAYRCAECHLLHIGHPPGWRYQNQEAR